MFDLQKPEVTTVIRWLLRVVLMVFLAWLVRRRPEQEEEEEEELDNGTQQYDLRRPGAKSRAASARSIARLQPRRDPYPATVRQRRSLSGGRNYGDAGGPSVAGSVDFDAVIEKISKPKEMWEVRKAGEGPPQILRRKSEDTAAASSTSSTGVVGAPGAAASLGGGGAVGSSAAPSERPRLPLTPAGAGQAAAQRQGQARGKENTLHGHERPVTFITWNRDGNLLFTCGKDKIVCVWSVPEGDCLGTYSGHSGAVWACSVTGDSRWLVTCGADRLVIVWEARASRELARVELPGVVRCVEWAGGGSSPSGIGERFVTCHNRFGAHPPAVTVWRFDGTAIEELLRITSLPTAASQVRWGRSDYFVASAHENGELIFWRSDTGAEVRRLKAHDSAISKFEFSHDRELVATVSHDKSVRIWDVGKGAEWKKLYHVETDRPLNAVALGPLTRAAAVGLPAQRPSKPCVIAAGGQDARDVTTSSSSTEQFGTLLFKLGVKETIPCELTADGVTKGHFGPVHTLAFARDGSAIASGSEDGCVRLHLFDNNGATAGGGGSPAQAAPAAPAPPRPKMGPEPPP